MPQYGYGGISPDQKLEMAACVLLLSAAKNGEDYPMITKLFMRSASSERCTSVAGESSRLNHLKVIAFYTLLPLFLFVGVSEALLNTTPVIRFLNTYQPDRIKVSLNVRSEAQVLRLVSESRAELPGIAFIGSSSVANGIDEKAVAQVWEEIGLSQRPVNLGITGLMASELAMLSPYLLSDGYEAVVFLYNSFSFSDELQEYVVSRGRMDIFLEIATRHNIERAMDQLPEMLISDLLFVSRYRHYLGNLVKRAGLGQLEPPEHLYDYATGRRPDGRRARNGDKWPDLPADSWQRRIYTTSVQQDDTIGYRGFEYFLRAAANAGLKVIVMAVPEPEFSAYTGFKRGLDTKRVDVRVEHLSRKYNAIFIPHSTVGHLEARDELFRDPVHLNDTGRDLYSDYLAKILAPLIENPTVTMDRRK
ncbi:MAG: hypothetical protein COA62_11760 [Rhodobiaceae bacterium]|nr:MAG: hypothetical protein COA62_11760 [Rhodobiaceae bacterium]